MSHEKTSVKGYAELFEGTGIHHSNSGLQISQNVYKRFLRDRVRSYARSGSVGRSHVTPTSGDIRIDLKFAKALDEAITCLLYQQYENSVHIDLARIVSTDFS